MSPFCLPSALRPQGLATLLALAAATAALPAQAQNLLQNGSFEQGNWVNYAGSWAKLTSGSSALSGWAVTGDPIAWSSPSNSDGVVAFDGARALDMTGFGNENRQGGIAQSFATHAGASYRVSFMLGGIASYGAMVRLRVDVAGVQQDFTLEPSAGNTWSQRDLDFVAQGGLTTLTLSGVYNPNGYYIGLDAVSVTAAVPEPQAAVLLLAGLGGLSLLARRRRC
jgi:hypothetical protein